MTSEQGDASPLIKAREAARRLGIPAGTFYLLLRSGDVPYVNVRKRKYLSAETIEQLRSRGTDAFTARPDSVQSPGVVAPEV